MPLGSAKGFNKIEMTNQSSLSLRTEDIVQRHKAAYPGLSPRLKFMLIGLALSTSILFIRSIYRTIEVRGSREC